MLDLLPIRKIAVGIVATSLFYLAHALGLSLGHDATNNAAQGLIGWIAAYIIPDPRVVKFGERAKSTLSQRFGFLLRFADECVKAERKA